MMLPNKKAHKRKHGNIWLPKNKRASVSECVCVCVCVCVLGGGGLGGRE